MGLIINVFRSPAMPDCSINGISAQYDTLTVVNVDGPFEPDSSRPAVYLVKHPTVRGIVFLVDEQGYTGAKRGMFGGNFGYTSDSRFNRAVEAMTGAPFHGAVKFHDRYES